MELKKTYFSYCLVSQITCLSRILLPTLQDIADLYFRSAESYRLKQKRSLRESETKSKKIQTLSDNLTIWSVILERVN